MATEQDIIKNAQKDWGESKGISFDPKRRVYDVKDNFGKELCRIARRMLSEEGLVRN